MFADEARFGRINRPRPCWAPIGTRREVASQLIREYIYLYGAVSPKDGTCVYLIMPTSNTACFQAFLNVLSRKFARQDILLVLDGAPTTAVATSRFPTMSRCCFYRPIRQTSTRRRLSGMKSARKSSRTTPSNPSTPYVPSSSRRSSISNAIQNSSNQSPRFPISLGHPDVEVV
jgi:transposase-like protein